MEKNNFFSVDCPSCGAPISVPYWGRNVVCSSCGGSVSHTTVVGAEIHHRCVLMAAKKGVENE